MLEVKPDEFLVGSGDGFVCLVKDLSIGKSKPKETKDGNRQVKEPTDQCLKEIRSKQFSGPVTSLAKLDERTVLVGCKTGDIFQVEILTFESKLLSTCHTGSVNDIAFPK